MAVFRIEKTRDYTVMSNHHLKDRTLTLKSKGLLSMMLSLPDEWNYTTRGLAAICREGVDSIGAALKELENHGYIRRTQLRDAVAHHVLELFHRKGGPAMLCTHPVACIGKVVDGVQKGAVQIE